MIINTQFVDAAGTPINGTIVVEGNNHAVLKTPLIDGTVGAALDPGDYTVVIFAGGRVIFGPHEMTAREGKFVRKERT